jgi:hypothetical protein
LPFARRWKNNSSKSSSTGQFDHLLWGPGESLPTLKAEPEKMKSLLNGHRSQMPNLIQLVQGTEQALPLYDQVHGSGPGEIVFLAVLPLYDPVHGNGPGEIVFRHMSVVQRGVRSRG